MADPDRACSDPPPRLSPEYGAGVWGEGSPGVRNGGCHISGRSSRSRPADHRPPPTPAMPTRQKLFGKSAQEWSVCAAQQVRTRQRQPANNRRSAARSLILHVTRRNLHCVLLDGRYPPICTAFGSGLIKTGGKRNWTFCVTVLGLISSGLPRGVLRSWACCRAVRTGSLGAG